MLSYTFSRREKTLLAVLAVIVVVIVWFLFVYQRTTNEIGRIDGEITAVQTDIDVAMGRVSQMNQMQSVIDKYKAKGETPTPIPDYDNMTAVMSELNAVLASSDTYSLAFDALKNATSGNYVLRGVRVNYSCGSREAAEDLITRIANGPYPCSVDSISISDASAGGTRATSNSAVSAAIHVTYFERQKNQ